MVAMEDETSGHVPSIGDPLLAPLFLDVALLEILFERAAQTFFHLDHFWRLLSFGGGLKSTCFGVLHKCEDYTKPSVLRRV